VSELHDTLRLAGLDHAKASWSGTSRDVLRRTGPLVSLEIDRPTWEAMGRPVTMGMTLDADTQPDEELEAPGRIVTEVYEERIRQIAKGYDAEHDDGHGLEHILSQVNRKATTWPPSRDNLVRDAALLIAAIEWYDRNPDHEPAEFETDDDPNGPT